MRRPSTTKLGTIGGRDVASDIDNELRTGSLAPSELPPRSLEAGIGSGIRRPRKPLDLTMAELAGASGISGGMVSKIENSAVSPSLATLDSLGQTLHAATNPLLSR